MALLLLPKGRLCGSGQKQMCHLCGWLKIELKKMCGGENKKYRRVGNECRLSCGPVEIRLYVGYLSKLAFHFMFIVVRLLFVVSSIRLAYNVLALGEEADFEAQNCLPALNLMRSTKLQLTTEPAFCQTPLIASGSCPPSLQTIVGIKFLCHCRGGCALRFLFF
jgi:hypothetical protein